VPDRSVDRIPLDLLIDSTLTRRRLLAVGGGAVAVVMLPGCFGGSDSSTTTAGSVPGPTGTPGGVVNIVLTDLFPADSLDPAIQIGVGETMAAGNLYEGLVYLDWGTFEPQAQLAESWTSSDDFTEWTFKLRAGVKFHDGKPLTAADAAWSLKRSLDESVGSGLFARMSAAVEPSGIVAADDQTLVLRLKRPDSNILQPLGSFYNWIVPEGTTNFDLGIGTGPFKLESFKAGSHFELSKNEDYWQPDLPYLDGVTIRHVPEPSTRVQAVLSGQADLTQTQPELLNVSEGNSDAYLLTAKAASLYNCAMDETVAPFDDERIRKAVKLGLDRQRVIEVAYGGHGVLAPDATVPFSSKEYFTPALEAHLEQNLEESAKLLAEAGHPDGIELTLLTNTEPGIKSYALAVADALAQSNIKVNVEIEPAATYWEQTWMQAPFFCSIWFARQPLEALSNQFASTSTQNEPNFDNPEFDALLEKAFASSGEEQLEFTQQALELVASTSGDIIPAYVDYLWLANSGISGLSERYDVQVYLGEASKA
jgi:peptide/nickel transport system substrate-binding protein